MSKHLSTEAIDTLANLQVGDVMNRTMVTVLASQEMAQAAHELRSHDVSCAPVIDASGRCVGILSASDFVRREAAQYSWRGSSLAPAPPELVRTPRGEWSITVESPDTVEKHMSHGVQSIAVHRSVLAAARMMCDGHLHRLVVLDAAGRPEGMISTMDVIAALLNSLDEASIKQMLEAELSEVSTSTAARP